MLTTEPQPMINRQDLASMAALSGGLYSKLLVSWTGGTYDEVDTDYHLNIGPKGQVYKTCEYLYEPKHPTRADNSGIISIALDCGQNAKITGKIKDQEDFGPYPPTEAQLQSLGLVLAVLCRMLDFPVDCGHVCTHWELASFNGYGPLSKDPHPRFDLIALPYYERFKEVYSIFGCCYLRKLVKQELSKLQLS